MKAKENEIREIKKKLDDLRQKINEMEIQCREAALNGENLTRAITEKYNVDLESMFSAFAKVDEEKVGELSALLEKDKQTIEVSAKLICWPSMNMKNWISVISFYRHKFPI